MSRLQKALFLSDKGYADLKKAIFACTLTNLAMLLPFCVTVMIFSEILTPFVNGGSIQWNHIWMLWGAGIVSAILVFLAAKNDYRKTYIASYKESNTTRLRIAEHLRKLPMNFFNTKDLSELTTNMMADCSSMESLLSSTIPPLIANGITVTLTCILLAFFDWRLALCVFITVPIAFLIIWLSRNHQKKLFEKQVDAKLAASDQVQEYLEGITESKESGRTWRIELKMSKEGFCFPFSILAIYFTETLLFSASCSCVIFIAFRTAFICFPKAIASAFGIIITSIVLYRSCGKNGITSSFQ